MTTFQSILGSGMQAGVRSAGHHWETRVSATCCPNDIGAQLISAVADLKLFYDKWYGAENRTDDGAYYTWSFCGEEATIPTESHLTDIANDLCNRVEDLRLAINALRDTIILITRGDGNQLRKVYRRPDPADWPPAGNDDCNVACDNGFIPAAFTPEFTESKLCDDSSPSTDCEVSLTHRDYRIAQGHRICEVHYNEIQAIVDDIMTNGVVWLDETVLTTQAQTPCGNQLDKVCGVRRQEQYLGLTMDQAQVPGDTCCYAEDSEITGLRIITYEVVFANPNPLHDCQGVCYDVGQCWGFDAWPKPQNGLGGPLRGTRSEWVQNGVAIRKPDCDNDPSWLVPCQRTVDTYRVDFCDHDDPFNTCDRGDTTNITNVNVGVSREDVFGGPKWRVGVLLPHVGPCYGLVQWATTECEITPEYHLTGEGTQFTVTEGDTRGGCPCGTTGCPGPLFSDSIVGQQALDYDSPFATPCKVWNLNSLGSGTFRDDYLKFGVKLRQQCPVSGVTNAVMADPRMPTSYSTTDWESVEIHAPDPPDPNQPNDCPYDESVCCDRVCLRGYAELA